jgi:hypothetical protein
MGTQSNLKVREARRSPFAMHRAASGAVRVPLNAFVTMAIFMMEEV